MGRIVTLGEVVADVYRERSPSEVEQPFTARPGGAPANVAVAAARLGVGSGFIGRVGDDLFGDFILNALAASGVDTSAILRDPPPTRTTLAFVEVSEDGDRAFTFYRSMPAADELLAPEDIKQREDLLTKKYNAAHEEMVKVAAAFNEELKEYQSRGDEE